MTNGAKLVVTNSVDKRKSSVDLNLIDVFG